MQPRKRATFAEVRDRTSKAALVVFSQRGFEASSVQRVADEVGMSKQALMHHFPTKESIRTVVFETLAEHLSEAFPAMHEQIRSLSHEQYRQLIDDNANALFGMPEVCRFLTRELLDRPQDTREWLCQQSWPFLAAIRKASETGGLRDGFDPEAHTIATASLLLATSAMLKDVTCDETKERIKNACRRLIKVGSSVDK